MKIFKVVILTFAILGVIGFISSVLGGCFIDSIPGGESVFETESLMETESLTETESLIEAVTSEGDMFSDLTMVCLGDSITMGSEIDTPYSDLVRDSLGLKNVHNYGVGWSTIGFMADCTCHANVDYEYDHHPYIHRYNKMQDADIVAVMGGSNDWGIGIPVGDINDTDETTFCGALNLLIDGLKEKYPDSYIFFMTLFNYVPDRINKNGVSWIEYNNAIREICAKKGIDVFDVYNEIPFDKDRDTVDGVHPTQEFVTNVWSPAITEFIRQNYKK